MMKKMIYNKMELNRENKYIKAFGHKVLHFFSPSGSLSTGEGGGRGFISTPHQPFPYPHR